MAQRNSRRRPIRSEPHGRLNMCSQRRADLDALVHQLRAEGLTFQAIAEQLGVTQAMARRRVLRHERTLREQAKPSGNPRRSRQ